MSIEETILEILADIDDEIPEYDGDNLFESGLIDSFQVIDLVNELEDAFDIDIDAKYVVEENFLTVDTIIELVKMVMDED